MDQKKSAGQLRYDLEQLEKRYDTVLNLQHEVYDKYGSKVARYLSMPGLESVATNIVKLKEMSPEEFLRKSQKQISDMEVMLRKSQGHFKEALYSEMEINFWMADHPKDEAILMFMPGAVRRGNSSFFYDSDQEYTGFRRDSIEDLYGMADEITEDQAKQILLETKSMKRLKTVEEARALRTKLKASKSKKNKAEKPKRVKNRVKSEQVKITEITF